ncbi:MAG: tetratricopeptide repeat protein [Neptuniibacter sp.]
MNVQGVHTISKLMLLSAIFFLSVAAQADSAVVPREYVCKTQGLDLSQLKQLEILCSASQQFNYSLGIVALEAGEYSLAVTALERVVLQNPQHAGAWLDLATVYYRSGEYKKLHSTIEQIESRFNLPPGIRLVLNGYKNHTSDTAIDSGWASSSQLELELGYASNVNNGSRHRYIKFADLELELSDNNRPQEDWFNSSTLQTSLTNRYRGWNVSWWGAARDLRYHSLEEHNSLWFIAGGSAQKSVDQQLVQLAGYHLWLNTRNGTDQNNLWLQYRSWHELDKYNSFSYWLGFQAVDSERQSDSRLIKVGAEWSKRLSFYLVASSLEWTFDKVRSGSLGRSGGDRQVLAAKIGGELGYRDGVLSSRLHYRREWDAEAYSPALFDGERKDLTQIRFETGYLYPIADSQKLELWLNHVREVSDIGLFDSKGWEGGLRWRYFW